MIPRQPDPWRAVDAQPTAATMAAALEVRGRTPSQVRLRRRFLKWLPVRAGARVLEVGCGTGVVARDLAALVGRRGVVTALDTSATLLGRARALSRSASLPRDQRIDDASGVHEARTRRMLS